MTGLLALPIIAKRRRPGTASRNSSILLPGRSVARTERPVTLPPGRASDATRPVPTGSPANAKTIGITDVVCFAAATSGVPDVLGRDLCGALGASLCPPNLYGDGARFNPAEFTQPLYESSEPLALGRRRALAQESDGQQLRHLLRARRKRPRDRRAAEQCDERAARHSITSSARASRG